MAPDGIARPLVGAVLTGGRSTRMGVDKATLHLNGESWAGRTVRLLGEAGCSTVWVIGSFCPDDAIEAGAIHTPDRSPGSGPLPALCHALALANGLPVVVLPCDLPYLTDGELAGFLGDAVDAVDTSGSAAAIAELDGRLNWVAGLWMPEAQVVLAQAVADGERSIHGAAQCLELAVVTVKSGFRDVDRPSEL